MILLTLGGLIVLCGLFSAYAAYHRRKKKLSERERKRNARKKLRAQKKKRWLFALSGIGLKGFKLKIFILLHRECHTILKAVI